MIVGSGMLATAFAARGAARRDLIVFASGVSNSNESRESEFARERSLLSGMLSRGLPLVYFSSCGVIEARELRRPYMRHKQAMEALVLASPNRLVVRLPQVVGRTANPNTLTNYLDARIRAGDHFDVWAKAERNLVDIDHVADITLGLLGSWSGDARVTAIAARRSTPMPEMVAIFERVLDRKANFSCLDMGSPLCVQAEQAWELGESLGIDFADGYAESLIRKYYEAEH